MGCADQRPTKTEPAFRTQSRSLAVSTVRCSGARRLVICARFVDAGGDNDQAIAIEGFARDWVVAAARFVSAMTSLREIGARGDEDGQRFGIVLGLRDEVGGDVGGAAALAGDDDFSGAGKHVDGAVEGDEAFGRGDVEIAGADDLVDARDGFGSVGERGHGVRAAEAIELGDAEQMRGGQRFRRGLGRDNHDALDARDLRGNCGHQQRGWQRMTAAGHIAADRAERANKLAGGEAGDADDLLHDAGSWRFANCADLRCGRRQGFAQRGIDRIPGGGHLFARDAQMASAIGEAVELCARSARARGRLCGARRRRCA